MRNYTDITERLQRLNIPIKVIGTVHNYPMHQIHLTSTPGTQQHVLITGGVHGDEPAGIEAVLQFLERDNTDILKNFSFVIIPCINPHGYVHSTRETRNGIDINRAFEMEDVLEVNIFKAALQQTQFSLAIDFHEDYDATGFYLYEGKRDEQYIGPELAAAAKAIGPPGP